MKTATTRAGTVGGSDSTGPNGADSTSTEDSSSGEAASAASEANAGTSGDTDDTDSGSEEGDDRETQGGAGGSEASNNEGRNDVDGSEGADDGEMSGTADDQVGSGSEGRSDTVGGSDGNSDDGEQGGRSEGSSGGESNEATEDATKGSSSGSDSGSGGPSQTTPTQTVTSNGLVLEELSLEDELIRLRNTGNEPLALAGYTITARGVELYTFPEFVLGSSDTVTVHLGPGEDTDTDLYAGYERSIPQMESYTLIVKNADGTPVIRESS